MQRLDAWRIRLEKTAGMHVPALVYAGENTVVDENALVQLRNAASLTSAHRVLATPDIHVGYGVPIGCVLATEDTVSPSAVGYDINCGMRLLSTEFNAAGVDCPRIARALRREIPLGEGKSNIHLSGKTFRRLMQEGLAAWELISRSDPRLSAGFSLQEWEADCSHSEDRGSLAGIPAAVPARAVERGRTQLGTLGGGNHFIELQEVTGIHDQETAAAFGIFPGQLTVMIHSGSRGFGHEIAGHYMRLALDYCTRRGLPIPARDLTWLPAREKEGQDFIGAMRAAANFAYANRLAMAVLVRRVLRELLDPRAQLPSLYDVTHNMVKREQHGRRQLWVHRKGATRAFDRDRMAGTPFSASGQPVIIPGSMGTASYLLVGCSGGAESLYSVCHGAGRVLSRKQARGSKGRPGAVSEQRFQESMEGVHLECENRRGIKEEAPDAYKDIDDVIATVAGAGLARVVARLRPLAVLKG